MAELDEKHPADNREVRLYPAPAGSNPAPSANLHQPTQVPQKYRRCRRTVKEAGRSCTTLGQLLAARTTVNVVDPTPRRTGRWLVEEHGGVPPSNTAAALRTPTSVRPGRPRRVYLRGHATSRKRLLIAGEVK